MMKRYLTSLASALLLASCSVVELDAPEVNDNDIVFFAKFDEEPDTRTYLNEEGLMRWTADDRLTIFAGKTYNQQYAFGGETGAKDGSFSKVGNPDFVSGSPLPNNIAVYPYSSATTIDDDGTIHLCLPETQAYAENSFGLNANTMVAATENRDDNTLLFKNVCGYLRVSLYGDALIKSITLTGNDGEKIAGAATVVAANGQVPSLTMAESATDVITINCGDGVQLGTTAGTATTFLFVVPETAFGKGITIKATSDNGAAFLKTTSKPVTVSRNKISKMALLEFEVNYGNITIPDPAFKAYCVANFDKNGDGEISFVEARDVEMIVCSGSYSNNGSIRSLDGIEYFTALNYLYCDSNQLTSLDVSKNTSLTHLYCAFNQLTNIDVSKNTSLTHLDCAFNQLTNIDVSKNTSLIHLDCNYNKLTRLDVSRNTALTEFDCGGNQLTSLVVNNNIALTRLDCCGNKITGLDVSRNTALTELDCDNNRLTMLDVSRNTALITFSCHNNQLTSLDVSKNTSLTILSCGYNNLTRLDISKNTALTRFYCGNNQLTSLSVSNNTALTRLDCESNKLTKLDVSRNTVLTELYCYDNQLTSLNVINNTALITLFCGINKLTTLDVSKNTALTRFWCHSNQLTSLDVSNNTSLTELDCSLCPSLKIIWLKTGQRINSFDYDTKVATIKYKN